LGIASGLGSTLIILSLVYSGKTLSQLEAKKYDLNQQITDLKAERDQLATNVDKLRKQNDRQQQTLTNTTETFSSLTQVFQEKDPDLTSQAFAHANPPGAAKPAVPIAYLQIASEQQRPMAKRVRYG
jgi:hypothetical protein